jgi:hypothetical protein
MDYIYHIIVETRSADTLEQRVQRLHERGLFPLPEQNYTKKYKWFRRITNSRWGRTLLRYSLPYMKREK